MADKPTLERRQGVVELTFEVKAIGKKVDKANESIDKIDKTLHGNGGEGLVTRMSLVEKMADTHESCLVWWRRTVLGGFVVGFIYLMYHILKVV